MTHILIYRSKKVTAYMTDNYDTNNIKKSVKCTIKYYEAWQRTNIAITRTKEETSWLIAGELYEKIYIYICGPLFQMYKKKGYIIWIIDYLSRYISLTAVLIQSEKTIKKTIFNKWNLKLAVPKEINGNCWKSFESKNMKELAK